MDGQVVGLVVADEGETLEPEVIERALPPWLHFIAGAGAFDHLAISPLAGNPVVIQSTVGAGKTRQLADLLLRELGATPYALTLFSSRQTYEGALRKFEEVIAAIAPTGVPQPEWFTQAQRNAVARDGFLKEFGALDSEEVAELAGSQAENRRATAHRWQENGRIFSVPYSGRVVFPGFQFDPESGQPKPGVRSVLDALPLSLHGWQRALWWATPSDLLEWRRPVDMLDESPGEVVKAARAEADDWRAATGE